MVNQKERLHSILAKHPYLQLPHHQLNEYVVAATGIVEAGGDPTDQIDRIEAEIDIEEKTIAAAFKRFDTASKGVLDAGNMKHMSAYLGFPHSDADIQKLMSAIEKDGSGQVRFVDFCRYVGGMGGSLKLFEERRKRISDKGGFSEGDAAECLKISLNEAGIDEEAMAYWRLVASPSEFRAAEQLVKCQKAALLHIRRLAKKNHQDALPKVQKRISDMGYTDENLWMTLAWIRELAPVIIHINIEKMLDKMESDTHYRNQFETKTSGGLNKPEVRRKWERDLFGKCYDSAKDFDRPKYGVQNVMNDYRGVVKCAQYGESYIVLKDVRLRCTFSPEDSANLKANRLAVLDFYAHVLNEYSEQELKETLDVATKGGVGNSSTVGAMHYKEAQIHGEINFPKHVERLVVHTKHRTSAKKDRIQDMCNRHGFPLSWMDEEAARMRNEDQHKMAGTTWMERLATLEKSGAVQVPEGFCKVGCGRKVNPGTTRNGKPFTTCCKGCIMGFGHDKNCGHIDPNKVGPGLCKHGCGRSVARGTDGGGRPLDTCCRGCALGMAHDPTCGKSSASTCSVEPGMCTKGCGRPVARGTRGNGQPWTTCCKPCATGSGHAPDCVAGPATPRAATPKAAPLRTTTSTTAGSAEPVEAVLVAPAKSGVKSADDGVPVAGTATDKADMNCACVIL
mmetsp:Transcript_84479/g.239622  ORF Transcript_84479/g.239622 Transcript_84479/m.239622 type:complete len:678 (-) Transcript_84479:148-2181(-)